MEEIQKNEQNNPKQTIVVNQVKRETNGIGTAGFVMALIALFFGWVPFFGWLLWVLGLVFSIIGMFKKPRGLAVAGLIISFIGIILLILLFLGIGALVLAS